jgi:hypothetical protein
VWAEGAGTFFLISSDTSSTANTQTSTDGSTFVNCYTGPKNWSYALYNSTLSKWFVCGSGQNAGIAYSPNINDWQVPYIPVQNTSTDKTAFVGMAYDPVTGLTVALSSITTIAGQVLTTLNGSDWRFERAVNNMAWKSICWSPALSKFCAVANDGGSGVALNRVMTGTIIP